MADDNLKPRQQAGENIEHRMLGFLMQFDPARTLTVADVKTIATAARTMAFEEFSEVVLYGKARDR